MPVNSAIYENIQQTNCAFCSAAGAVNLTLGHSLYTTQNVQNFSGGGQGSMASAAGDGQDKKIIGFVEHYTRPARKSIITVASKIELPKAIKDMKLLPERTVFALKIDGRTASGATPCHWLNALRINNAGERTLRYFDFQTVRDVPRRLKGGVWQDPTMVGGKNPSTSVQPFVGIIGQNELFAAKSYRLQHGDTPDPMAHRSLHAAVQSGTFLPQASFALTVIAFPPP